MINQVFGKIYSFLEKHRKLTLVLFISLFLVSAGRLLFVPFNNNIELMLPADAEFLRSLTFLRESNFSDKVVLSLHLKDEQRGVADLIKAADQLKNNFKPPLISTIESGIVENEVLDDIKEFLQYVPQIVSEEDLAQIDHQITPENVSDRLKQGYKSMLSMNSMFAKYFIQHDPLDIKMGYLKKMKGLAESLGYKAKFQGGHFISGDDKHVMLILTTPVLITDGSGARKLMDYINGEIDRLPDYIGVDIICGHLHSISNEVILRRDIAKTVFAATLMLLVLLLVVLRSLRALLVFIIPVVAIVISMNITSMVMGSLSSFVVGLAAVIVGITVDYGIHIYLAMQAGGLRKVHEIAQPILVGVFTTMGVFISFFFSNIYGYQQFALLTNLSIVISIFFYLFILPRLFYEKKTKVLVIGKKISIGKIKVNDKMMMIIWMIMMGVVIFASKKLTFSNDLRVYDGSAEEIFNAEQRFHETWGGENEFAMLVAQADNLEDVLQKNEFLNSEVKKNSDLESFVSMASVYPSKSTRIKNWLGWERFWNNARRGKLSSLLEEQGKPFGYAQDAFTPFFDELNSGYVKDTEIEDPKLIEQVKGRFLQKTKTGYYAISYFPDENILVDKIGAISKKVKDSFIISRNNMARSISEAVYQEVKKLAWIAGLLIVFLTFLLLKNIRLTLLALLPVVTSVFMISGSFALLGYSLSASSMIAILVVVGLCIDYGVFMVYDCKFKLEAGTLLAVTLSAVTTIVGGSVLLLASHPVLFYVGMTMTIGILSGYLSAIFVVPAGYRLWNNSRGVQ